MKYRKRIKIEKKRAKRQLNIRQAEIPSGPGEFTLRGEVKALKMSSGEMNS